MDRKAILNEITALEKKHCKNCETRIEIQSQVGQSQSNRYCVSECDIGKEIQNLGKKLFKRSESANVKISRHWTQEEEFYLINHMNVLGLSRVSKKLGRNEDAVLDRYNKIKKSSSDRYLISHIKNKRYLLVYQY